jgi:predicted SAM-dependent methyltransferase
LSSDGWFSLKPTLLVTLNNQQGHLFILFITDKRCDRPVKKHNLWKLTMQEFHKETSAVRKYVLPLLPTGDGNRRISGIDVGFGGDKVREDFLGCDLPHPYGKYEGYKVDIPCDVSKGIPVNDSTFDVVYSSHLIEDFLDTAKILKEFARICKPHGKIILVFPNQEKYVAFCKKNGTVPNGAHKIPQMGIAYMLAKISELDLIDGDEVFCEEVLSYNCIVAFNLKK